MSCFRLSTLPQDTLETCILVLLTFEYFRHWPAKRIRSKHTTKGDRKRRNRYSIANSSSMGLSDTNSQHGIGDARTNKIMHRSTIRPIRNLHMRRRFPKLSPMLLKKTDVIVSPSSGDDDKQRKRQKVEEREEPSESDDRSELALSTPEPSKVKRLSRMLAELRPHNGLGLRPDLYEIDVTRRPRISPAKSETLKEHRQRTKLTRRKFHWDPKRKQKAHHDVVAREKGTILNTYEK